MINFYELIIVTINFYLWPLCPSAGQKSLRRWPYLGCMFHTFALECKNSSESLKLFNRLGIHPVVSGENKPASLFVVSLARHLTECLRL